MMLSRSCRRRRHSMAPRCSSAVLMFLTFHLATSWSPPATFRLRPSLQIQSTPFEAGFYENPYEGIETETSSLSVPSDTKLVIGLTKYSHDTSLCAADAATGDVLFATSKERLTRRKHDSGNVAVLVETCLDALDLQLENIASVVVNNHHHRVLPMENNLRHMEWEAGLDTNGGREDGYDEPENRLPGAIHHELSHHLAHAYSTAAQAPFDNGVCVVMDGMGETFRAMQEAVGVEDLQYTSDLSFGLDSFQCVPSNIVECVATSPYDWREAESVYVFSKSGMEIDVRPVFKRFTPENSPPTLDNHGFENMDSVGAVYSRASSHIFGDWNACGKVMGLAPWANYTWIDKETGKERSPVLYERPMMAGSLYSDTDPLQINRTLLEGMPCIARNDADLFTLDGAKRKRYDFDENDTDDSTTTDTGENKQRTPAAVAIDAIAIAHRVQTDLETVVLDFVKHFKTETGESNLCLAGGVALNSVLNGRLARELGFAETFVSPYPGDDGIAVGCCAFGLFGKKKLESTQQARAPSLWNGPLTPYLGDDPSESDIQEAIKHASPWLEVETIRDDDRRLEMMATEIKTGAIIAWYHSRSEIGPRALGHRSILADPRKKGLVRFINEKVKSRESFRPFAPSVLVEEASSWFDLGPQGERNVSPFMSMTAMVHEDKRDLVPAVTHVDGSSRLQTVSKTVEPLYHKLISKFYDLTGIPMVLNTSFNTLPSEPIVESPKDAIRAFLYSMGSIEMLVMGDYVIKRKNPNLKALLGEMTADGDVVTTPLCPKRSGRVTFKASFEIEADQSEDEDIETSASVRMPGRPIHGNGNEWFDLLDDLEGEILSACDGTVTLSDILAQYSTLPEEAPETEEQAEETQNLLQNLVHRLVRLYEHTLVSW